MPLRKHFKLATTSGFLALALAECGGVKALTIGSSHSTQGLKAQTTEETLPGAEHKASLSLSRAARLRQGRVISLIMSA